MVRPRIIIQLAVGYPDPKTIIEFMMKSGTLSPVFNLML
jgi:hypothetical protein